MKALIFAAGLGTRLRPVTDTIPKALVPVGGVPMLGRVICRLRDAGISDFVVNAHHFRDKVVSYLGANDFGVHVAVSLEEGDHPLETGGGIRHARPLLESRCCTSGGRFMVHNVDILSNLDIPWFLSQDSPDALATLLLVEKEADRYLLFDEEMRLAGWTNVRTGEVKSPYPDFDPSQYRRFSFCGIHVISEAVFPLMESWPDCFGIIDFYLAVCRDHIVRGVVAPELDLIDIGSPETLEAADAKFRDR